MYEIFLIFSLIFLIFFTDFLFDFLIFLIFLLIFLIFLIFFIDFFIFSKSVRDFFSALPLVSLYVYRLVVSFFIDWPYVNSCFICTVEQHFSQARIQEKNEPPQNFPVSRFYPMFPRFSQCFPEFSLIALLVKFSRFASANVAVVWIRPWQFSSFEDLEIFSIV